MGEVCEAPLYLRRFLIGIDDPKLARRHTRTQVTEEPEVVLSRLSLHTVCDRCLYERPPFTPAMVEDGDRARVGIEDSSKVRVHRLPRAHPAHEREQWFVAWEFVRRLCPNAAHVACEEPYLDAFIGELREGCSRDVHTRRLAGALGHGPFRFYAKHPQHAGLARKVERGHPEECAYPEHAQLVGVTPEEERQHEGIDVFDRSRLE